TSLNKSSDQRGGTAPSLQVLAVSLAESNSALNDSILPIHIPSSEEIVRFSKASKALARDRTEMPCSQRTSKANFCNLACVYGFPHNRPTTFLIRPICSRQWTQSPLSPLLLSGAR